jgi:hypothetical protein
VLNFKREKFVFEFLNVIKRPTQSAVHNELRDCEHTNYDGHDAQIPTETTRSVNVIARLMPTIPPKGLLRYKQRELKQQLTQTHHAYIPNKHIPCRNSRWDEDDALLGLFSFRSLCILTLNKLPHTNLGFMCMRKLTVIVDEIK